MGVLCAMGAMVATPIDAATISSIGAAWPASAAAETVDANSVTPNANRGLTANRVLYQSFGAPSAGVNVETVFLSASGYADNAFTLEVLRVSDTLDAATFAAGTPVSSIITVDPAGSTGSGNLEIALAAAEQFALSPLSGPAGYAMRLTAPTDGSAALNWVHGHDGVDYDPDGRYLRDDGSTHDTRDYGLAVTGSLVPEPAASALALLSCGLFRGRRRGW